MTVHLKKLSVGAVSIDSLRAWQEELTKAGHPIIHPTRNWPRRREELLDGGSIYWIIKGKMQARQKILKMEEVQTYDGETRCGIFLDPHIIPVWSRKERIFQGWRYLEVDNAPDDMPHDAENGDAFPADMAEELRDLGLL